MDLRDRVSMLPTGPGCYLFKDGRDRVIYVGKAKNLRARVRQYVSGTDGRLMVPFLMGRARDVDVVLTSSEKDALILENTLIKKHRPKYNQKLVDDSSFLHLHVELDGFWPRFQLVRHIKRKKRGRRELWFGPFASASRARATLEFLNRRFPLRTCSDRELRSRTRPCLLYQMHRCVAPCVDACTPEEYQAVLDQSLLFLEGKSTELVGRLRADMGGAAEREAFEEAARLRDLIRAIEASMERQSAVDPKLGNRDVWGLHRDGLRGVLALVPIRKGMMQEAVILPLNGAVGDDAELLSHLLNTWYGRGAQVPEEVLLPVDLPDREALAEVLGGVRGTAVRVAVPQRGLKARWLALAVENARTAHQRRTSESERRQKTLLELQAGLRLPMLPRRMECFDNSNIQGTDAVASMVVFTDGLPDRARYRRYKIKTVVGADDYASMREVLGRRLRRGLAEGDLPDLLVVDGGKGQLSSALAVMHELGIRDQRQAGEAASGPMVPVIGLVKPRTERRRGDRDATDKVVLPGVKNPIQLRATGTPLRLLQAIRDESHRTAVRFHRDTRSKRTIRSSLDDLPGIGDTRRRALLGWFGSMAAVRGASVEQIAEVPGFGPKLAAQVVAAIGAQRQPTQDSPP